jgi:hypothetical protein
MAFRSFLVAAAVVLSAALMTPAESAAQRQRWPGGNGGGQQNGGGGGGGARQRDGGAAPRDNGGGRQRDSGGARQRDGGGARRQDGGGGGQVRSAQPRGDQGDRGRRERPTETRETPPPPPAAAAAAPEAGGQDGRQARRRYPTDADRDRGVNISRGDDRDRDRGNANRGGIVRDDNRARGAARTAVPRVGRAPDPRDRNFPRGYNTYRNYGGRNIYVIPRGRTFLYYPRYYYRPYTFGYGPAGRGHFYFDLYYNSYVWHPYSVYRYGTYGNYGYPVGELRLKVRPRDAQVFIDGYYAGRVDDFDGVFQSLRLEDGDYQVEIVLPGYEPLAFDVRIFPGEKTTYEGDLIPE